MNDKVTYTGYMPSAVAPRLKNRPVVSKLPSVPKYVPNGSGRDTYHNIDLSTPKYEFKLRDYDDDVTGFRWVGRKLLRILQGLCRGFNGDHE